MRNHFCLWIRPQVINWCLCSPGLHSWFDLHDLVGHVHHADGDLARFRVRLPSQEVVDPRLKVVAEFCLRQPWWRTRREITIVTTGAGSFGSLKRSLKVRRSTGRNGQALLPQTFPAEKLYKEGQRITYSWLRICSPFATYSISSDSRYIQICDAREREQCEVRQELLETSGGAEINSRGKRPSTGRSARLPWRPNRVVVQNADLMHFTAAIQTGWKPAEKTGGTNSIDEQQK